MKLAKIGDEGLARIMELRKRKVSLRDIADFIKKNYRIDISHEALRLFFEKHELDVVDIRPDFLEKIQKVIRAIDAHERKLKSLSKKMEEAGKLGAAGSLIQKAVKCKETKARLLISIAPKQEDRKEGSLDAVAFGQRVWSYIGDLEKRGFIRILKKPKTPDIVEEVKEQ